MDSLPTLDPSKGWPEWTRWLRAFDLFIEAKNYTCFKRRKAMLLHMGGLPLQDIYYSFPQVSLEVMEADRLGDSLTLVCQVHGVETKVMNGKDFHKLRHGGCTAPCPMSSSKLSCGHPCQKLCHPLDTDHKHYQCPLLCLRTKCEDPARHACPNPCHYECSPCMVEVPKVVHSCGHTVNMYCSQNPLEFNCNFMVAKTPPCGHTQPIECSMDPEGFYCKQDCTKTYPGCHHKCIQKCGDPCGDCEVLVDRRLRCEHIQQVKCSSPDPCCIVRCSKDLPCGHNCRTPCHSGSCICSVQVQKTMEECGHVINVPCSKKDSDWSCSGYCSNKLDCGHYCNLKCRHRGSKDCCCPVKNCKSRKGFGEITSVSSGVKNKTNKRVRKPLPPIMR